MNILASSQTITISWKFRRETVSGGNCVSILLFRYTFTMTQWFVNFENKSLKKTQQFVEASLLEYINVRHNS